MPKKGAGSWRVLLKNLGGKIGTTLHFSNDRQTTAAVLEKSADGEYRISVDPPEPAVAMLERLRRMPLPPYIRRDKEHDPRDELDRQRYQTVFAKVPGAVAAPTAALHFTPEVFAALDDRGIGRAFVTLQVGIGTFKPVTSDTLEGHAMHVEAYSIDAQTAAKLNRAKSKGRRIIAVGTTAARVLESQPRTSHLWRQTSQTGIFIYPPYRWKHVDAMVTNFHLPRSTLIALVAAMTGLDEQRRLYRIAIENNYRFFSYGDAMLIESKPSCRLAVSSGPLQRTRELPG